jgi:hypothetical protein
MMTELTEAQKQITNETQELLVSLDEKQNELTEYQTNVVNIQLTRVAIGQLPSSGLVYLFF